MSVIVVPEHVALDNAFLMIISAPIFLDPNEILDRT
jgi:hypothetical protein